MKTLGQRNIYEHAAVAAWEELPQHISGAFNGLLCVVSEHALAPNAKLALDSSANKLGYGPECVFVTLAAANSGNGSLADDNGSETAGGNNPLNSKQLFKLVESLDPLALVAADSKAAAALSHAYNAEVAPGKANRLLGRTCVAFVRFEDMLNTPEDKQRAWAALKMLAR